MDGGGPRRRKRTTPVGRTGARFAPLEIISDQQAPPPLPAETGGRPVGARFGPYSAKTPSAEPENPPPEPGRPDPPPPLELLPVESDVLIRPYARTGGRTRPTHEFALEALVTTAPQARSRHLSREHRAIANLCLHPRSVAEVAALLAIPLGVARVLLGDLASDGSVRVDRASTRPPDLALLHRVLTGLRRL